MKQKNSFQSLTELKNLYEKVIKNDPNNIIAKEKLKIINEQLRNINQEKTNTHPLFTHKQENKDFMEIDVKELKDISLINKSIQFYKEMVKKYPHNTKLKAKLKILEHKLSNIQDKTTLQKTHIFKRARIDIV